MYICVCVCVLYAELLFLFFFPPLIISCEPVLRQDCIVSEWRSIGECSKSCNGGMITQHRKILSQPLSGKECPGLTRVVECNAMSCDVAGEHKRIFRLFFVAVAVRSIFMCFFSCVSNLPPNN